MTIIDKMTNSERMIMSRTPLRISFAGGGTDIGEYYSNYGTGAVVSAAINKYIHIVVNKKFDNKIRVSYAVTEIVDKPGELKHPSVREALELMGITGGIEIISISDIPSSGTGLGSSSTFLVGLLNALHAYLGEYASPKTLSEEAVKIEREILKENGGKQDQYIAAYGGIQLMEFYKNERVDVTPIIMDEEFRKKVNANLLLLYTGKQRSSSNIHAEQKNNVTKKIDLYRKMAELARQIQSICSSRDADELGVILHKNWLMKKELSGGISDSTIDRWYEIALKNGAIGGKIIGAGGGGFMLFYVPEKDREKVIKALPELSVTDFQFDYRGSRIVMVGD